MIGPLTWHETERVKAIDECRWHSIIVHRGIPGLTATPIRPSPFGVYRNIYEVADLVRRRLANGLPVEGYSFE